MSDRMCSLDDCDRRYYAKGYCCAHYLRSVKYGDPQGGKPIRRRRETRPRCSVEGCDRQHYAKGWCQSHYNRWKKHRDVQPDVPVADRNSREGTCRVEGCGKPIRRRLLCNTHGLREQKFGDVMAHIPIREPSDGTCAVSGCERPHAGLGWCGPHYQLFKLYKMTPDDYDVMLARQGGGCAICGASPSNGERLHVDHDHACCPARKRSCGRCVRGLLCSWCNHMLGYARDEPETLQRAMDYITRWRRDLSPVTLQVPGSKQSRAARVRRPSLQTRARTDTAASRPVSTASGATRPQPQAGLW